MGKIIDLQSWHVKLYKVLLPNTELPNYYCTYKAHWFWLIILCLLCPAILIYAIILCSNKKIYNFIHKKMDGDDADDIFGLVGVFFCYIFGFIIIMLFGREYLIDFMKIRYLYLIASCTAPFFTFFGVCLLWFIITKILKFHTFLKLHYCKEIEFIDCAEIVYIDYEKGTINIKINETVHSVNIDINSSFVNICEILLKYLQKLGKDNPESFIISSDMVKKVRKQIFKLKKQHTQYLKSKK